MPEEADVVFKEQKVKSFQEAKKYKCSRQIMKMIPYALARTAWTMLCMRENFGCFV